MSTTTPPPSEVSLRRGDVVRLWPEGLDGLIGVLRDMGYDVKGPTVRDGAIVPGRLDGAHDLPVGWRDEQSPGRYAVHWANDELAFSWAVGPGSWKAEFFPAAQVQWHAERHGDTYRFNESVESLRPLAIVGARPCELAALDVLDRVLRDGALPDPRYVARRDGAFVVVVECARPASTCFCSSMGAGPGIEGGFDLALTELSDADGHRYLVRIGSERGALAIARVDHEQGLDVDRAARVIQLDASVVGMTRQLETDGLAELLVRNQENPRWLDVAERCLSCANCTLVCPTCFCSDVHDTTDVTGAVTRNRTWSSCFDLDHSFLHGGPVRASSSSRYRQWMTHKLSTWWDQFDTSGCVGCGRCITWCPVGIDITDEAKAIGRSDRALAVGRSR